MYFSKFKLYFNISYLHFLKREIDVLEVKINKHHKGIHKTEPINPKGPNGSMGFKLKIIVFFTLIYAQFASCTFCLQIFTTWWYRLIATITESTGKIRFYILHFIVVIFILRPMKEGWIWQLECESSNRHWKLSSS